MTAQIDDVFTYQNNAYSVAGVSDGHLFLPSDFGMSPVGTCTACWRGYKTEYALKGSQLIVDDFYVELHPDPDSYEYKEGPVINGQKPTRITDDIFNNHYEGLELPVDYRGGLLLATDFVEDLYVHMGYQPAWKYRSVLELIFEEGILRDEFDRSEKMAMFRERMREESQESQSNDGAEAGKIPEFIRQAFDRRYGW